ncbi:hypothetical protein [Streptacidiphilus rugosus]|uniref:hypothetical protein n=1 Tax=Streptacidiphilus rugosus TaxID=405783 RepID=UPI00056874D3|nr:hypothetical protein [Streptacidiphilus rugosus]
MYATFNLYPSEVGSVDVECDQFGPLLAMTCGDVVLRIMLPVTDTPADALPFVRAFYEATGEFLALTEQFAIAHLDPGSGPDSLAA